jgi:hypothetical protein
MQEGQGQEAAHSRRYITDRRNLVIHLLQKRQRKTRQVRTSGSGRRLDMDGN